MVSIHVRGESSRAVSSAGPQGQRMAAPVFRAALLAAHGLEGRFFFSRGKDYPTGVFSVIAYDHSLEKALLEERRAAAANMLLTPPDDSVASGGGGRHYAARLHAEHSPCCPERDARDAHPSAADVGLHGGRYEPQRLDPPHIDLARSRRTYNGEGYLVSILTFTNERALKDEINERFAAEEPWLDFGDGQGLTLSKLRSLKRRALDIWWANGWELSTVALACIGFERLVLLRLVNKGNRKLAMAACLLLAYKMNEAKDGEAATGTLQAALPRVRIVAAAAAAAAAFAAAHAPPLHQAAADAAAAAADAATARARLGGDGGAPQVVGTLPPPPPPPPPRPAPPSALRALGVPPCAPSSLQLVLAALEGAFAVARPTLLAAEFPVFVHLRFSLKAPAHHVAAHLARLLASKGVAPQEYLRPQLLAELGAAAAVDAAAEAAEAAAEELEGEAAYSRTVAVGGASQRDGPMQASAAAGGAAGSVRLRVRERERARRRRDERRRRRRRRRRAAAAAAAAAGSDSSGSGASASSRTGSSADSEATGDDEEDGEGASDDGSGDDDDDVDDDDDATGSSDEDDEGSEDDGDDEEDGDDDEEEDDDDESGSSDATSDSDDRSMLSENESSVEDRHRSSRHKRSHARAPR